MLDVSALRDRLILEEELMLKPYRDTAGKLTIGVGRNLDDEGISHDEAMLMLENDIASHIADLDRDLAWWRGLSDNRQLVLADMCFNLGISKLLMFKNTLDHVSRGEYEQAADGMLASLWASQVGARARKLAELMRAG